MLCELTHRCPLQCPYCSNPVELDRVNTELTTAEWQDVMRQAAALRDYRSPVLLPGIRINTGPDKFQPIKQMRLVQFDGRTWQPIGDVIESAFTDAPKN